MTEQLTELATELYWMELPDFPREPATREVLFDRITDTYPEAEFAGDGQGRIVIWLPEPPHRQLTEEEQKRVHDGIVVKFAYNPDYDDDGRRQNRTEATIWENGSPLLDKTDLVPVFESGEEHTWLIMPYRDLIPNTAQFEEAMIEKFGEIPTGDLAAKDSWGLAGDGSLECCDYGRCPNPEKTTIEN